LLANLTPKILNFRFNAFVQGMFEELQHSLEALEILQAGSLEEYNPWGRAYAIVFEEVGTE
jgi:hypothetical protein